MIFISGFIKCDDCDARVAVEFETEPFGHDINCLFVKAPYPYPDGWQCIDERGYYSDDKKDVWLCPKHWKKDRDGYVVRKH